MYREVVDIEWEELIDFAGYFSVTSNVDNPTITTPLFANLKVKDAIVDRIKEKKTFVQILVLMPIKQSSTYTGKIVMQTYLLILQAKRLPNMATVKFLEKHRCWKLWQPAPY